MSVYCRFRVTVWPWNVLGILCNSWSEALWGPLFKVWKQKQWGRDKCMGVKPATWSKTALRRERTAFVLVLWYLSQSKWSLIFCKLLLVQAPVWWLTFTMPNPNFSIQSQTKIKQKEKKPRATPSSFRSPISLDHRLSLKKQCYFFLNQFTVLLMCDNGHFWIVASAS